MQHLPLPTSFPFAPEGASPEAVWEWTPASGRLQLNPEAATWLQLPVLTTIEAWESGLHPEDLAPTLETLTTAIQNRSKTWQGRYRYRTVDKGYVTFYHKTYLSYETTGNISCVIGSLTIETNDPYPATAFQTLLNSLPAYIGCYTLTGELIYLNTMFRNFLSPSSVALPLFSALIHPDDVRLFHTAFKKPFTETVPLKFRCRRQEGSYRWLSGFLSPLGRPENHTGYMAILIDTTAQETGPYQLGADVEKVRFILEGLPQMAWTAEPGGEINYFTRRWYEYTGQTEAEAMHMGCRNALHPEDDERAYPTYIAAVASCQPYDIEKRIRRAADGQFRWHLVRGIPLFDSNGKLLLWTGTCTDIHDQKLKAESLETAVQERTAALQLANAELERANAELEQFAFVASHDLQEPLRKIQLFSDCLQTALSDGRYERAAKETARIQLSAARLRSLLKDILAYSTQTQKAAAQFELMPLSITLTAVQTALEKPLAEKGVRITIDPLPELEAAPGALYQLFCHLLSNSLKFAASNRPLEISIRSEALPLAEKEALGLSIPSVYFRITITDNGIGFDAKYSDQIFSMFQRLNPAADYPGTGIGLAICKKIVTSHQGLIFANGEEGKGAEFTIILPQYQES